MANVYKSRYTGEQIEQLLNKANDIQTVTAFPDPQDGDYLGAIEIDNRPYLIPKGTKVEANVGGVEGAYILTITIGEQKYVMPAYVSPNPAESGTIELNKLAIGSTIYTIPNGAVVKANDGGVEGAYLQTLTIGEQKYVMPSYVFPNPAAEATQTLTKLAIGNVVYELPSGGVTPVYYDGEFSTRPIGGATLISFTIDPKAYQAEEGMTWAEWVESEYNTDGYINSGYRILSSDHNTMVTNENYEGVTPTDVIIAGYTYKKSTGGAG